MSATKAALAVRSDLETWQELNVAAFLTSGLGTANATVIGEPYVDGSGVEYPPMLAVPIRVFAGDDAALRRALQRALDRDLLVSVYTEQMFATMNDADNRAAVAAYETADLPLVGLAIVGDGKMVDKAFDKLKLHGA